MFGKLSRLGLGQSTSHFLVGVMVMAFFRLSCKLI
jgi:hypothetical protein